MLRRSQPAFEITDEELFWEAHPDSVVTWADDQPSDVDPPVTPATRESDVDRTVTRTRHARPAAIHSADTFDGPRLEPDAGSAPIEELPTWALSEARPRERRWSRRGLIIRAAAGAICAAVAVSVAGAMIAGPENRDAGLAVRATQAAQARSTTGVTPAQPDVVAAPTHAKASSKKSRPAKKSSQSDRKQPRDDGEHRKATTAKSGHGDGGASAAQAADAAHQVTTPTTPRSAVPPPSQAASSQSATASGGEFGVEP